MKKQGLELKNSLFCQSKENAFITIVEAFDKIKKEIGFNKMAYDSHLKTLVESVILCALFLPYELSADFVEYGDEHIKELTALLDDVVNYRHKLI